MTLNLSAKTTRDSVMMSLKDNLAKSVVIDKSKESSLAHFALSEIHKGKKLGSGQFGNVFQVDGVEISEDDEIDIEQMDEREFVVKFCHRETSGEARYAIKILRKEIVEDPQMFIRGLIDLAMEANFLSNLEHPNIIKVRGAGEDAILGTKDYFVMMDRLGDTLDRRMDQWKKTSKKLSGPAGLLKSGQKHDLLVDRLHVAFELSAALSYLHQNKIVYRDLELHSDLKVGEDNSGLDLYKLTSRIGTLIYMAPEVVIGEPYNEKADVYSFAMLLWEMLALKEPFPKCTAKIHEKMVVRGSHRPEISKKWPSNVQALIEACWAKDLGKRLNMKATNLRLKNEMQQHVKQGDLSTDFTRRRSTHVFKKGN
eukprot:scaffold98343_cov54-Attheya_sp.AAC.1